MARILSTPGLLFPEENNIDSIENSQAHAIPGLRYIKDYISTEKERDLLAKVNEGPWLNDLKRRVQHFGWRYDYKQRTVLDSMYLGNLPFWLEELSRDIWTRALMPVQPDQVIINEYMPGQGISPHIDCEPCFGNTIISLSLGSACIMEFTHRKHGQKVEILLKPRSLVVLSGESRSLWTHGIPARKQDVFGGCKFIRSTRVSLTFRKVIK